MTLPRVVHINDQVVGAIYVGRAVPRRGIKASKWANSYKIGRDGDRGEVIDKYLRDLSIGGAKRHLLADLPELRGKALACWCCHDGEIQTRENACHGHALVRLLDMYTDDELRAMGGEG